MGRKKQMYGDTEKRRKRGVGRNRRMRENE
jgi:hypothetical protein